MSFVPTNVVRTPVDTVLTDLTALSVNPSTMTEEELRIYRLSIAKIQNKCKSLMADTSTKQHNYEDNLIKEYINIILCSGLNCCPTGLSAFPQFKDAQHLSKWQSLIKECVNESLFVTSLKTPHLKPLVSNIAKSKTLHELRQAVKLIIEPLKYYQQQQYKENIVDELTEENNSLHLLAQERKRVVDELLKGYDEECSDIALLKNCEAAKKQHDLSDDATAKLFNISRKKLLSLRNNITLI